MEEDFSLVLNEAVDPKQCSSRKRVILHFDIDCFYAQVEMIKDPSLVEKPLGIKQKNIVVTCNYVARSKGVVKCSYITEAMKVCPELVLVNGEDLADYRKSSQQIFDLIYRSGNQICPVEKLGMDENFMDVTDLVDAKMEEADLDKLDYCGFIYGDAKRSCTNAQENACSCHQRLMIGSQIAQEIRDKLYDELCITSSCGIAHNKVLAKIGGGQNKPNKQTIIFQETSVSLMRSLPTLRSIPGLGSSTCDTLAKKGIRTIIDLQSAKAWQISEVPDGQKLIDLSFGQDPSEVKLSGKPLSIGLEDRFKCMSSKDECLEKAKWLLGRLAKLVLEDGRKPQTLKVFIRDYEKDKHDPKRKFAKYSRQCKINSFSFKDEKSILDLAPQVVQLIGKMVDFSKFFHLTLMGLSVTDFVCSSVKKGGIDAFLAPKSSVKNSGTFSTRLAKTEVSGTGKQSHSSKNLSISKVDLFLAPKRACPSPEEEMPNKKAKPEAIPDQWDKEIFENLPEDVKKELLSQNQPKASTSNLPKSNAQIPCGWDQEVFSSLPQDIKNELLDSNKKKPVAPLKKGAKNKSSILSYFSKT